MTYELKKLAEEVDGRLRVWPRIAGSQLARDVGVSRKTLYHLVKLAKGVSFRSYQQSMLLEVALPLLKEAGHLTVKEIAFSLGYSSPAAFSRFIRSRTGRTPSEIRDGAAIDVP